MMRPCKAKTGVAGRVAQCHPSGSPTGRYAGFMNELAFCLASYMYSEYAEQRRKQSAARVLGANSEREKVIAKSVACCKNGAKASGGGVRERKSNSHRNAPLRGGPSSDRVVLIIIIPIDTVVGGDSAAVMLEFSTLAGLIGHGLMIYDASSLKCSV
ncbi:hypothetical protein DL93DRAFT_2160616 [Clavulina sp. PMI_390]|nr:hypothetical protein DL93DRAFT_2160616 [Clavulina sp. PMI_390]